MASRRAGAAASLLIAVLLALGLTSCGEDEPEDAASRCDARDELAGATEALDQVDVVADGTDALVAAVDDVRAALSGAADVARSDLGDEVDAVEAALDDVDAAVDQLGDAPATQVLQDVATPLGELGASSEALVDALGADCD